jgi:DNA topoisomerase I
VRKGRFGPYVQHGQTVANLPRGTTMDDVTLDEAVALLAEKGKTLKPRGAAAKKGRGARPARVGAKAEATSEAAAKPRVAPRKQPARPATKTASAAPKKTAAKKPSGAKKAKKRAAS